MLMNASYDD